MNNDTKKQPAWLLVLKAIGLIAVGPIMVVIGTPIVIIVCFAAPILGIAYGIFMLIEYLNDPTGYKANRTERMMREQLWREENQRETERRNARLDARTQTNQP
jgi:hypothetical protein